MVDAALPLLPPWWYRLAGVLLEPWAAGWGQGGQSAALAQRHGRRVPHGESWLHAASVGEAAGIPPLADAWRLRRPGESLLASAGTVGGRAVLERELREVPVSAPPVDSLAACRRSVAASGVRRLILLETELWPAWLAAALERDVRLALASARLSDRSWPRTRRAAGLFRPYLERFHAVAAQTPLDAQRWIELGAAPGRVKVTGNLKYDRAPTPSRPVTAEERRAARLRLGIEPDAVWWTWGSLRPGEERVLSGTLESLGAAGPRVLVVPRHPDRWRERSGRVREGDGARWMLGLGTLADAYRAADFAVVGGTLAPYGGHNPVEPAALGVPVLLGPWIENCRDAATRILEEGGGRLVRDASELAEVVREWTADAAARARAGQAAFAAAQELRGATTRTLDWFEACGLWA